MPELPPSTVPKGVDLGGRRIIKKVAIATAHTSHSLVRGQALRHTRGDVVVLLVAVAEPTVVAGAPGPQAPVRRHAGGLEVAT
eukprot:COSAG05_NODE_4370_length_1547_cov_1.493094_1_plen_83_part_00